jgi:hypothetical protein
VAAIDLFRVGGQADRADDGALLQGLARALDLQVLDEDDAVAVGEQIAERVTHLRAGGSARGKFRGRQPLARSLVIDIVVVGHPALHIRSSPRS